MQNRIEKQMGENRNSFLRNKIKYFTCIWVVLFFFNAMLIGCGGIEEDDDDDGDSNRAISFVPVTVPSDDVQKRAVRASTGVTIDGETYTLGYDTSGNSDSGYETIMRSGDSLDEIFGLIVNQAGRPIAQDGARYVSSDTDFSSLLQVNGGLYSITHFETLPGAAYQTAINQNYDSGQLSAKRTRNIDVAEWGGLWLPSGGSVTPWETHLGGEVREPNARAFENAQSPDQIDVGIISMLRYFNITYPFNMDDIRNVFNPYSYGYPFEIAVENNGDTTVNKRYAMGRLSVAQAYVMPDEKTVYIMDSVSNGGLFIFVADVAGDLNAGNLFAAKWDQADDLDGGRAKLKWIELGHATQDEVKLRIDQGLRFSEIFDIGRRNHDGTCSEEYYSVNTNEYGHECLAVRSGMELAASRLETRRYAALMGATTEFHAAEGVTFDSRKDILYISISEVNNGMEDNMRAGNSDGKYDLGGANDIRLPYNCCGCVYGLKVHKNRSVGSKYTAKNMYSVLCGEARSYGGGSPYNGNKCDVDNIANPDNMSVIPGYGTLIIAEASEKGHVNNALWTFEDSSGDLARIQTSPYGGENASAYFYPDINGFSYITSVIKHPFGGEYQDQPGNASEANSYVGYIGAMPAFE